MNDTNETGGIFPQGEGGADAVEAAPDSAVTAEAVDEAMTEAAPDEGGTLGPAGAPFVNRTDYDTRALAALNRMAEATVRKEKSQKTRMLCLVLGVFGLVAGYFCYKNNTLIGSLLALYGALLLFVGVTWKSFRLRSSRRQLQRGAQSVVYEFDEEEIVCRLASGVIHRYAYNQIEAVVSDEEWYAIFFDMDHGIVLDKAGFTAGDAPSFKSFIGQHTMLPIQEI